MQAYKNIVACCDFSPHSRQAFFRALHLARQGEARLKLVHVIPRGAPGKKPRRASDLEAGARQAKARLAEELISQAQGFPVEPVVRLGHPAVEIVEELKESQADLAVLGAQGLSGLGLTLFGSVSQTVSRNAPCSCLIVREP